MRQTKFPASNAALQTVNDLGIAHTPTKLEALGGTTFTNLRLQEWTANKMGKFRAKRCQKRGKLMQNDAKRSISGQNCAVYLNYAYDGDPNQHF